MHCYTYRRMSGAAIYTQSSHAWTSVRMHMRICICMYIHMRIFTFTCASACAFTCTCTFAFACTCAFAWAFAFACAFTCAHLHLHLYVHLHSHAHLYSHLQSHLHAHKIVATYIFKYMCIGVLCKSIFFYIYNHRCEFAACIIFRIQSKYDHVFFCRTVINRFMFAKKMD